MKKALNLNSSSKETTSLCTEQTIRRIVFAYLLLFLVFGLSMQSLPRLWEGLLAIFSASGVLITDYLVIAGVGPSFVNAAIVGLIGCLILVWNDMPFTGLPIAAVFTMFGFALFGKNILSILPIILGSYLFALVTRQPFKDVACAAMFATCLAPLGPHVAFVMELGLPIGIASSIVAGFLVPAFAKRFFCFHEGFNLYNIGFTAGITGTLIVSAFRLFGYNSTSVLIWGDSFNPLMRMICIPVFASMCGLGWWLRADQSFWALLDETGIAPSNFVSKYGFGVTLFNMGLTGLLGVLYIELVGGHYNGPTVGGLFTLVGFGAFGKHPKNCFPIMLGIYLAALVAPTIAPTAPGAMLAALFGTTLAPIAGKYGLFAGIMTGMCHFMIVLQVGVIHGGLNLYNNGFSGGFTAIIIISLFHALRKE